MKNWNYLHENDDCVNSTKENHIIDRLISALYWQASGVKRNDVRVLSKMNLSKKSYINKSANEMV